MTERPTVRPTERLTPAQARRIAVAAQGLGRSHPRAAVGPRHLDRVLDAVGVVQIDSVNVLVRSHYLPVFSRLGPYRRELLDRAAHRAPRRLVEYWAHQASYTTPATHALLGFRMVRAHAETWSGLRQAAAEHPHLLDDVRAVIAAQGPLTSAEIEQQLGRRAPADRGNWGWNWSHAKMAIEYLFHAGDLASAGRTTRFERRYDLPERVLGAHLALAAPPEEAEACRELVAIAARAHGIGTEACLRDYFRLSAGQSRKAVAELVEDGRLVEVQVAGWRRPAYLDPAARIPARLGGSALLSPFDSLVWFRPRTEALFGFHYRIGIYTPAAQRTHGYYVLPYLLGDRLVARVDVAANRAAGVLSVPGAWLEEPPARGRIGAGDVARALAADLRAMAQWLGLDDVVVGERGDLTAALRALGRW
ncbi:MAG: YcaQ family DNA glycosylase [Kineosporiaceae bacterium]|nr:YcaQ family DNA glycosylase [Kineosporiaceae bacterium]